MIKSISDTVTTASENKHELDERGEWMKLKNSTDARQDRTDATLAKNQSMLLCEIRKLKGEQCTIKFIEVEQ